jgi:hypothetical protein
MAIERDKELKIWTYDEAHARHFFGFPESRPVRILKDAPETPDERSQYEPNAKLFAVLAYEPPAGFVPRADYDLDEPISQAELEGLLGGEDVVEQCRRLNGTDPRD